MSSPIRPIGTFTPPIIEAPGSAAGKRTGSFGEALSGAIANIEQQRASANDSVNRFLSGEGEELHTAVLKTQKAELSFELFMQVRNKVVQAYQEVMRMQM